MLERTPLHRTGMGFEPPQFQRLGPVHVGDATGPSIAQELIPLVVEGKSGDSVSGPAAESFREREGLRSGGF